MVPVPGAVPRADVVLEYDRLPGAPLQDQVPHRREGARNAAHAERHGGDRPLAARVVGELPGRDAGRAAAVRRPGPRHQVTLCHLATIAPGGVPERSNGAVLKTVEHGRGPWVRIPTPPLS